MKRFFVSAAVLPLLYAAGVHAETKISTATTTPVRTSTIASGHPDNLTIETGGSIAPTAAGAAVTIDTANTVVNNGAINFNNLGGSTGILINGGLATTVTNAGNISLVEDFTPTDSDNDGDLDGPFAQGAGRFGIRAIGSNPVTGSIVHSGTITIEGADSAGISVETRLDGALTSSGAVSVTGDRGVGVRADSVSGDVKITGSVAVQGEGSVGVRVGDVGGTLQLQNLVSATGYRSAERLSDAARAKLDADDLKQGGGAVRVTGNVGKGILLDRPPADNDSKNNDEDGDGVADAGEGTATLLSLGAAPALDVGGTQATSIGALGTGALAFGVVNRGSITGNGVNDGVAGVGLRIGQAGGGVTTVQGGISNTSPAVIVGRAFGAQSTAVLLNSNAVVPALVNAGTIGAEQNGGLHDARGVVDLSGTLTLLQNSGTIRSVVNPASGVTQTGRAIAIDLSANTSGAIVRQLKINSGDAPSIGGDVLFGSGDDRLELLAGTYAGALSFGAGADSLVLDGGAVATAGISDSDGRLAINIANGRLALANPGTLTVSSLSLGASGVLAVNIDPAVTTTRVQVNGAASVATGAQISVNLTALSRGSKSFQIVKAQSLTVGQAGATLAGAPFLYQANLRPDAATASLFVDIRPKTAAELGLNRSGAEAFAAVFDSLDKNAAIENAFLAQTTQAGFQGLYDQLLPEHSGGALMSAVAASRAVSQAIAEPVGIDGDSTTGIWTQEIAFNLRQDRKDAQGFRSRGFGFAAGADMQGEANAIGANVSFVTADIRDRNAAAGENVTMNLVGAGLYWRLDGGPLQAAVRGGAGYAFFNGDRRLVSPTLDFKAKSDWGAWMVDGSATASYRLQLGAFYARPELSVDYLRLSEGNYREKGGGTGFDLAVAKRTDDLLTGQALLAVGWRFGDEIYWAPELKAGYRAKLAGGPGRTTAHFDGGANFTLDAEDVAHGGLVARAGVRGGAARFLFDLDGGATLDSNYEEYDVRATVRLQF